MAVGCMAKKTTGESPASSFSTAADTDMSAMSVKDFGNDGRAGAVQVISFGHRTNRLQLCAP